MIKNHFLRFPRNISVLAHFPGKSKHLAKRNLPDQMEINQRIINFGRDRKLGELIQMIKVDVSQHILDDRNRLTVFYHLAGCVSSTEICASDVDLLKFYASSLERKIERFWLNCGQSVSNFFVAHTRFFADMPLPSSLLKSLLKTDVIDWYRPHHISNILWSIAKTQSNSREARMAGMFILQVLLNGGLKFCQFSDTAIVSVLYSLASLPHVNVVVLYPKVTAELHKRDIETFSGYSIAVSLWAVNTMSVKVNTHASHCCEAYPHDLVDRLAELARYHIPTITGSELAMIVYSSGICGQNSLALINLNKEIAGHVALHCKNYDSLTLSLIASGLALYFPSGRLRELQNA